MQNEVNLLLTMALCLCSHFSKTVFHWCSAEGYSSQISHITKDLLSLRKIDVSLVQMISFIQRINWKSRGIQISCYSFLARNMERTFQLKDIQLQRAIQQDASHIPLCINQQLAAYFTKMTRNCISGTIFSFIILLSSESTEWNYRAKLSLHHHVKMMFS